MAVTAWDGDPTVSFTPNDGAANDVTCANAFGLGTTCIPPASFATRGGLGGIQVGYNWQPGRSWVVGVKSDFDWSRITGTGTSKFALPVGANLEPQTPTRRKRSNGSAPLRARLGWLATDNLLLYARSHLTVGQSARAVHRTIDNGANHGNAPFLPAPIASSATPLRRYGVGPQGSAANSRFPAMLACSPIATALLNTGSTPSSFTANFGNVVFNVVRAGLNYKF